MNIHDRATRAVHGVDKRITFIVPVCLAGLAVECGLNPGQEQAADPKIATRNAGVAASQVQTFLDQRYTAKDVQHTFTTKLGETVDCVDFFAEPGVKAHAARGTPLTRIPHFELPQELLTRAAAVPLAIDVVFHGELDDDSHAHACPEVTVAELRITPEHIERAGGLDAFLHAASHKFSSLQVAAQGTDYVEYAHVTVGWETFTSRAVSRSSRSMIHTSRNRPSITAWPRHGRTADRPPGRVVALPYRPSKPAGMLIGDCTAIHDSYERGEHLARSPPWPGSRFIITFHHKRKDECGTHQTQ